MESRAEHCTLVCAGLQLKFNAQEEDFRHSQVKGSSQPLFSTSLPGSLSSAFHSTFSLLWLLGLTESTDSGQGELTVCL